MSLDSELSEKCMGFIILCILFKKSKYTISD